MGEERPSWIESLAAWRRWLLPIYLAVLFGLALLLWRLGGIGPEPTLVLGAAFGISAAAELWLWLSRVVRNFFWRIRHKLIVSYTFIALAP